MKLDLNQTIWMTCFIKVSVGGIEMGMLDMALLYDLGEDFVSMLSQNEAADDNTVTQED